jgi:hypothetical protein
MNESGDLPLAGGCPCGRVRLEISEPLIAALYCHCKRCQRRTGSAFSVSALTVPGSLRVVSGEDSLRTWDPGDGGWTKSFCAECGGHVFTTSPDGQSESVRMGALDEDPGIRPIAHQFTDYAASWEPIPDDGLPRFPERVPAAARPAE